MRHYHCTLVLGILLFLGVVIFPLYQVEAKAMMMYDYDTITETIPMENTYGGNDSDEIDTVVENLMDGAQRWTQGMMGNTHQLVDSTFSDTKQLVKDTVKGTKKFVEGVTKKVVIWPGLGGTGEGGAPNFLKMFG